KAAGGSAGTLNRVFAIRSANEVRRSVRIHTSIRVVSLVCIPEDNLIAGLPPTRLETVTRSVSVVCGIQTRLQNVGPAFSSRLEYRDLSGAVAAVIEVRPINPVVIGWVGRVLVVDSVSALQMICARVLTSGDVVTRRAALVANRIPVVIVVLEDVSDRNTLTLSLDPGQQLHANKENECVE